MPGTVSEGPTVSLSFANNFWGKDDAGVQPLLERMHNAKVTCDELKTFYHTRASIEDEYAHKLLALCRKPLGSSETGTLRTSLDVMRGEVESMGKSHQTIAGQMKSELEEPLAAYAGGMKERRKIVQAGIEKLLKTKVQQTQTVNKSRDRYEQDCLRIKGYLAQGHMVMGQEERKNKAKLEKTQIQLASTSNEYEAAVKILEETTGRWNRDWKSACDKFQDLEEERLDFLKSSLWTFANVASTVCVTDDSSCEKIRLSLENCEVEKDITGFIQERGTGQEIPEPPKYINFCRGDVNDTASETSDDERYSVAQFQRTINPAFRTSSPQPSTYESHHDPQSDLAARLGHQNQQTPPSRERTMTPQKTAQHPPPAIDYSKQLPNQPQFPQQYQADLAAVPHNEYPTDGMTMFCRTDGPSEQSSVNSPIRPGSRDSQSDYSNPTSYSSMEPPSGKQSPIKQNPAVNPPDISPSKQVQKKRSGFFSNSPFRRKSKHDKESRDYQRPTSRNTFGPSSTKSSPTRQNHPNRYSNSPEPVDPRASFQLNVGPNVFDVASPDSRRKANGSKPQTPLDTLDPIAQALAELKGVTKQSSVRMSADRYHGIATPAPGTPGNLGSAHGTDGAIAAAQRGTPPPSYHDQDNVKRLDLPQPAFTAKQMQQTTQKYTSQTQNMYGSGAASRPGTRGGSGDHMPRATSPAPLRSTSPRPGYGSGGGAQSGHNRSASPNPYVGRGQTAGGSPQKGGYGSSMGQYSRHGSPNDIRRAASPQPQFRGGTRPASSAGMALQLSNGVDGQDLGGGSQGRRGNAGGVERPVSYYGGQQAAQQAGSGGSAGGRTRSKSMVDGRQYNKDGRLILGFARANYMYKAAIPEELGFGKGDVLAILRHQDDGWWEAEPTGPAAMVGGKKPRSGLVPSNYLTPC